jgi:uncharacterized protein YbaP (TraB family)
MKTKLTLLFLFVSCISSFAQENSLLWEIKGKGLKKPSYLYGTIHLRDNRVFYKTEQIDKLLSNCKQYIGEIVISPEALTESLPLLMLPYDEPLSELLSPEEYKRVNAFCEEKMGPMAALLPLLKPFYTSSYLSIMAMNNDMPVSLDEYLQELAQKKGLEIKGLETTQEQIIAIDKTFDMKAQAQSLLMVVDSFEHIRTYFEAIIQPYLKEDLESVGKLMRNSSEIYQIDMTPIIENRNVVMTERLIPMIKKAPSLIAVGAAHLPGSQGIIQLLRKQGYTVQPVK